jgi:hypothetical protein
MHAQVCTALFCSLLLRERCSTFELWMRSHRTVGESAEQCMHHTFTSDIMLGVLPSSRLIE